MRSARREQEGVVLPFTIALFAVFLFSLARFGAAQTLMEMNTAMDMNNTLNGGPTGVPGYTPSSYFGPVNRGPGGPGAQMGQQPGMMPGQMAGQPGMGQPQPAKPAPSPVKKILVLTGERVRCHVMGTLLEDIHYEYRPESEKGEFYDDGTHGDLQAGDNIWTNYTERNDVLSPEANYLKKIYLRMMELCEDMNPLEFFRIPVATDEPLSPLPQLTDKERDRDETFLRQWHQQFLALYRQDPDDPMSDFYPIFVPSPPQPPSDVPPPPENQFQPNAFQLDAYIRNTVDAAVAPALAPPPEETAGYGTRGTRRGYSRGGGYSRGRGGYAGDRWTQARQQAAGYSTYQSSSYFRQ